MIHPENEVDMVASVIELARSQGYCQVENEVELFYRTVGEGDQTVVFLHGGPGFCLEYFLPDVQPLAQNRRLLLYDQRSSGRSTLIGDPSHNTIEDMVADLESLRDAFDLNELNLVGHSWGSLLAGLYAIEYPSNVDRMALVGSTAPAVGDWREDFDPMNRIDSEHRRVLQTHRERFRDNPGSMTDCWNYWMIYGRGYHSSAKDAQRIWGNICDRPAEKIEHRDILMDGLGFPDDLPDIRDELDDVDVPTLVVHSEDGPIPVAAAEMWVDALPNAELFLLPTGGHLPWVDCPAVFFPAVDAFLHGTWPDAPAEDGTWEPPTPETGWAPEPNTYEALFTEIQAAGERYANALSEGEWQEAASCFTEDGMLLGPSAPPVSGRRAIAAYWDAAFERGFRSVDLQTIEVEGIADRAFELGKYVVQGGGGTMLDTGKFMVHWKETDDGWRIYRDVFNSSLDSRSPLEIPHYLPPPDGTFRTG